MYIFIPFLLNSIYVLCRAKNSWPDSSAIFLIGFSTSINFYNCFFLLVSSIQKKTLIIITVRN